MQPEIDVEALAKTVCEAQHPTTPWDTLLRDWQCRYENMVRITVTARDQDWQTAMETRTTALEQARDSLTQIKQLAWAFVLQDGNQEQLAEFERLALGALAMIKFALGEGYELSRD